MLRRTVIGALAAVLVTVPAGAAVAAPRVAGYQPDSAAAASGGRGTELQHLLQAVHDAGMPGAFAEIRDGRQTWTPTAGVADVATGAPVRDGMRHRVGSITKTFVATAVLQLVGERRIALDAPIGRYLSARLVPADLGRAVTVRMLLNHTSGIGNYTRVLFTTPEDVIAVGRTTYTPEQLVRLGIGAGPTNAPGAAWSYSNTNYVLAGLIIKRVTGHSYQTEIQRRILRPLGLRDTYFEGADPTIRGPHMHAYVPWTDGELRDLTRYGMSWADAAGDMVSTAHDLNVFYRALLRGRLLSPRLLGAMQTTVPFDPSQPTEDGGYGLGLYSVRLPCGLFWGHDGGTIGHQTISWHSADGTVQATYAHSMAYYQTDPNQPHPIDVALQGFLLTGLCGTASTSATTAPPPRLFIADGRPLG